MRVVVFTYLPSPYQVELFDKLAESSSFDLFVIYVRQHEQKRPWRRLTEFSHPATFLDRLSARDLARIVDSADLSVFGWYRHAVLRRLMVYCADNLRPWCYWGEAPGFRLRGSVGRFLRRIALRPLLRSDASIWCIGKWAMQRFRNEFQDGRRYVNVPYASNLARFAANFRQSGSSPRYVLYSGSLISRKGVDTLADAWLRVVRHFPDAVLSIVGDGDLRNSLEEKLNSIRENVNFFGAVDWDRLPAFYSDADILCAPSRYDGWGLIIPEALATGVPVIASTEMGSTREMVTHGVNGWTIPPSDVDALEDSLLRALDLSSPEFSRMKTAAAASVEPFDLPAGAQRFIEASKLCVKATADR